MTCPSCVRGNIAILSKLHGLPSVYYNNNLKLQNNNFTLTHVHRYTDTHAHDLTFRFLNTNQLATNTHYMMNKFSIHAINIGYTMKPRGLRDLEPRGNRYRHPRAKRKGVYRFPRGSKSHRPRGFHRIRYLYYSQSNHFSR